MDTVEFEGLGGVYRGTHYGSVGVYTNANGHTYAGGRKGNLVHGYGVVTQTNGFTFSGQLADGRCHGHCERHFANGDVCYDLFERKQEEDDEGLPAQVHVAIVGPDGDCDYDGERCSADHADFAALKAAAQQAGVRMPPTRIQRNARAVGRTATHAPFRFRPTRFAFPVAGARARSRRRGESPPAARRALARAPTAPARAVNARAHVARAFLRALLGSSMRSVAPRVRCADLFRNLGLF
jgi:hypothetical protein